MKPHGGLSGFLFEGEEVGERGVGGGETKKGDSRKKWLEEELGGGCCYTEELAGESGLVQSWSSYL